MRSIAIHVENLSKQYRIVGSQARYRTFRDAISDMAAAPLRRWQAQRDPSSTRRTFWALRDVSFAIPRGEVLGIIGRNGAGKSTLLKLLSRITLPTAGRVEIHGRIASLLEVGTGFHPELTGRENVYLNGSILGMSRAETAARFDEIVSFAGVEKFIDTPTKRYSSGMQMRLAFAVAAHLRPEILLIDEVLAVGDTEFQKKCIGKMETVTKEGRTILIVSHSMGTIRSLCSQVILLDAGSLVRQGRASDIVAEYLGGNRADTSEKDVADQDHIFGVRQIRVKQIRLLNAVGSSFSVYWKQPIRIAVEMDVLEPLREVSFGVGLGQLDGTWVLMTHHDDEGQPRWAFEPGPYRVELTLRNDVRPGIYRLIFGAHQEHYWNNILHMEPVSIEVLPTTDQGAAPAVYNAGIVNGASTWHCSRR